MNQKNVFNLLKALKNRKFLGLRTVKVLLEGEQTVTEIRIKTRVDQPVQSAFLKIFRDNGLVETRREGKEIYYSLVLPVWNDLSNFCKKIAMGKTEERVFYRAYQILLPICKETKDNIRLKIFDYVKANEGTPVQPIYASLEIEQSLCSIYLNQLQRAGWIKEKKDGKKRLKYINHEQGELPLA